jgi:hypothetical protein
VVFVKNEKRSCEELPGEARPALALCQRVHNAAGRDIASLLLFVTTYYQDLPRVLLVAHDHEPYQFLPLFSMTDTSAWVRKVTQQPLFSSEETCLCVPIIETHFRECDKPLPEETLHSLLPAGDEFSCYGVWWPPVRWIMEHILEADWRGGTIRWPSAAALEARTERPDGQLGLRVDSERFWPGEVVAHILERLLFVLFDVHYTAPVVERTVA